MPLSRSSSAPLVAALLAALPSSPLAAQDGRGAVVGVIVEEGALTPLEGAVVELVGTSVRVATGADGSFTVSNLRPGTLVFRVAAEGYVGLVANVEVAGGEMSLLQFRLPRLDAALEELKVEVSGRPRAGAGISQRPEGVSAEATAIDLLAHRIPGVVVRFGDNDVGSHAWISIRGFSSITQSNAPSVYVDGVRVASTDILQRIPAADVARIRVLRGASASTRFAESANGVIIIETRNGPGGEGGDGGGVPMGSP